MDNISYYKQFNFTNKLKRIYCIIIYIIFIYMSIDKKLLHNLDIGSGSRIIESPVYHPYTSDEYKLDQPVIIYNNGNNWRIVSKDIMDIYPIIYDKYFDNSKKVVDISITYCPFSGSSIAYFDKYNLSTKVHNNNIMLYKKATNNTIGDEVIQQLSGITYSLSTGELLTNFIQKHEVRLTTLKIALTSYPDAQFLHFTPKLKKLKGVFSVAITSSRFKPKELVYGIEYKSKDIEKPDYKYTCIVHNGSYDTSKIEDYMKAMGDKLREKASVIIPSYWAAWYAFHPNTKVISV